MIKTLIIYRVDKEDTSNIGVMNKLRGQIAGLQKNNCKVDFICHDSRHIYFNNEVIYKRSAQGSYLFFKWKFYKYLLNENLYNYNFYFIRYGLTTNYFIKWLKDIRSINIGATILIDMPTYPYNEEWKGIYGKAVLFSDGIFKGKLYKYVDYFLHSGVEKEIYSIPTIKSSNGVNVDAIRIKKKVNQSGYHFLAMAKWGEWHGLDRLIKGVDKYIKEGGEEVTIDVLGDGPAKKNLEKLCDKLNINNYINFHGVKLGHELDTFFDKADIGIGTLGLYRKNVFIDSSLKHREYIARGLPLLLSGKDEDLGNDLSFIHYVKNDDSIIDIKALIGFINRLDQEEGLTAKMRSFAASNLSWQVKMKEVLKKANIEKA